MKLLFVLPSMSNGGAERVVSLVASELAERGHDVTCIIYYKSMNEYPYSKKINLINLSGGDIEKYRQIKMIKKLKILRHLIYQIKPDYILPFLPQVGFHVWAATIGKRVKIIQTVRNNPKTDPETSFLRFIRNKMIKYSWKAFVQNEMQLEYFNKRIQKKMIVISNPVSENAFYLEHKYSDKIVKCCSFGRLSEQKNFGMLIKAFSYIIPDYPCVVLKIYGEGELHNVLAKQIIELNLENNVFLMGRTSEPLRCMDESDLFILSSNYEGMPNSLMEAMAVGLPCVSTDCETGPKDIICNGVNGWLTTVNDPICMANTIKEVMHMSNERIVEIAQKGRQTIKNNYSIEEIVNIYELKLFKD